MCVCMYVCMYVNENDKIFENDKIDSENDKKQIKLRVLLLVLGPACQACNSVAKPLRLVLHPLLVGR